MSLPSLPFAYLLAVSQAIVVPTNVHPPVYPPIAESACVTGDVEISVVVRPDGAVTSAEVVSGAPLLRDTALKAAREAKYECRECTEPGTPYSIVFRFQVVHRDDVKPPAGLMFDPDGRAIVNVVGSVGYWYEGAVFSRPSTRVRAAKCLWLWRCGYS